MTAAGDPVTPKLPVLLGACVALRLLLDLTLVPLMVAQALSLGLGGVALVATVVARPRHPLVVPAAVFGGWTLLTGLRGVDGEALRHGLHTWLPLLWLGVAPLADRRWTHWLLLAGTLPVATSLVAWATGQPDEHVLHGLPRLHGAYRNLHGHAVAMAVLVVVGAWTAAEDDAPRWRGLGAVMALLAGACLAATWVRTLMIFVGLALGTMLVLSRAWRTLGALGLLAAAAVAASPRLQQRFADVASLLTLTPPEEGWGALGSWRVRIWAESVEGWLDGPAHTWWLGRGLGGHVGLHRHLDPHHEYLSLLFQFGPVGLLTWLGLALAALGWCVRARSAEGRLGAGLMVAVLVTNAVSNEWLTRATLQWVTWGAVGAALRPRLSSGATSPPRTG